MTKKPNAMSRRASFKLATAVSTLAAGLGATLDSKEALAAPGEPLKLSKSKVGSFTIKLWKYETTAKGEKTTLIDTVVLSSVAAKMEEPGTYAIKFQNAVIGEKGSEPTTLLEQKVLVVKG